MFGLFRLGFAALLAVVPGFVPVSLLMLLTGCLAILDPIAARRREAPLLFGRLRPPHTNVH